MGLSAVYDIPVWLPTFGDLTQEWWAVAKLPDDVMAQLKEMQMAMRPVAAPRTPPGPPPFDGAGRDYGHGQFDPNSLIGSMPSVGNAVLDSVSWLKSGVCLCVCVCVFVCFVMQLLLVGLIVRFAWTFGVSHRPFSSSWTSWASTRSA